MEPGDHARQARYLLSIVDHSLIAANRQHQSEVLWGVATQIVKAVAKLHNLRNGSHRDLFRAVRRIGSYTANDPDLIHEFLSVRELHVNFYDGEMNDAEIEERRAITIQFVAKMQRILDPN